MWHGKHAYSLLLVSRKLKRLYQHYLDGLLLINNPSSSYYITTILYIYIYIYIYIYMYRYAKALLSKCLGINKQQTCINTEYISLILNEINSQGVYTYKYGR